MAQLIGRIEEFDAGVESITAYLERLQLYLVANSMAEEKKCHVAKFLAALASRCEFGEFLNEAICDHFMCRLRNERIQKCLLSEADLILNRAMELSKGMEAGEINTRALRETEASIKQLDPSL